MEQVKRYAFEDEVIEVPLRWDEDTQTYVEDYKSVIENPIYSPSGRPVLLTIEDACPYTDMADADPDSIDCGSCRHYHQFPGSLLVGLVPKAVLAVGTDTGKAIQLGTGGITGYSDTNSYDYIYFGDWTATDNYTASGPIKWRVLDDQTNTGGDGLFLLSDVLLGTGSFGGVYFDSTEPYSNAWQGSDAQAWCKDFYSGNLTTQEQGAVLATTKSDKAFTSTRSVPFAASEKILNGDRIFFLSAEEAENGDYGFAEGGARSANYGYLPDSWWLRSPGADSTGTDLAGMVDSNNNGAVTCTFLTSYPFPSTARPAFNLDPNSVLFTSAAAGGKASGAVGENALESVSEYSGSEWKLTLKDDRRSFTAETTATTIEAGQSLSISYSGAQTGDNEYVSVLLCDSADNVLYYGNIAGNSADGTASVTIPAVLDPDSYTLKVFSEQCNGDKKTDYASAFVNISLTVTEHIHRYGTDWKTDADKHWHECSCGAKADEADHKYDDRRDTTCNVCGYVRAAYYILTVDLQGGNGSAADGEYAEGAVINIDAGTRPNYHFSGWISSNGGSFADASSQGTTFTMPATDTTITANWQYEGGGPNKAIQIGASQIEGGQASNIYFGTYMQSRASAGVYNIDPIKWRVLSNADGKLFLLSNQNLDVLPYNGNQTSVTWENCTLRSWLNGTFLKSALSDDEQGAIDNTYVYNATQSDGRNNPNPSYSTPGGNNTTDKIFLLSIEEANNSSYFPNADSRISTNTAYVVSYYGMSGAGEADGWWLRSPGRLDNTAAFVEASGDVYHSGSFVDIRLNAVRPAFNLDQNAVLFTSAAVGGKSSGSVGTDALQSVSDDSGSEWKLTLLDEGRGSFSVSGASMSGGTVSFSYSGAQTGTDEYLSAVVVENGAVTHYGRILQLDGTAGGESGTASLSLPAGVTLSGNTKLYVFNEQYNGDKKTGYASDLVDIIPAVSADGREVELRANDTHIQWKYVDEGDDAWRDLVALSALTGGDGSDGADGREIELQNNGTTIQWRYKGDTTWNDLVDLSALTGAAGQDGADGREIELQNNGTTIQWRYVGETEWKDLVDLSALTGATGQDGKDGQDGADGTDGREVELRVDGGYIQWRYTTGSDTEWKNLIAVSALQGLKGDKGDKGDPGADGQDGKDGQDGSDGVNGKNGIDGKTAATGRTAQTAKTVKMALGLPALRSTTAASWSLPLPTAQKKISAR